MDITTFVTKALGVSVAEIETLSDDEFDRRIIERFGPDVALSDTGPTVQVVVDGERHDIEDVRLVDGVVQIVAGSTGPAPQEFVWA